MAFAFDPHMMLDVNGVHTPLLRSDMCLADPYVRRMAVKCAVLQWLDTPRTQSDRDTRLRDALSAEDLVVTLAADCAQTEDDHFLFARAAVPTTSLSPPEPRMSKAQRARADARAKAAAETAAKVRRRSTPRPGQQEEGGGGEAADKQG